VLVMEVLIGAAMVKELQQELAGLMRSAACEGL